MGRGLVCECSGPVLCGADQPPGQCRAQPGGYCFVSVEEVIDNGALALQRAAGCLPPDEAGLMQCRGSSAPHLRPLALQCCRNESFCNSRLHPAPPPLVLDAPPDVHSRPAPLALFAAALAAALLLLGLAAWLLLARRKRLKRKRPPSPAPPTAVILAPSERPLLQATVARQLDMRRRLGQGRYGEVWLAAWRGEPVAVKVMLPTADDSWRREADVYASELLRHEHLLGFVAADAAGQPPRKLLITEFAEGGSLRDRLRRGPLADDERLRLAAGMARGLAFLHAEVRGARGKPALAHRDLSSLAVLLCRGGRAALADLGLAARARQGDDADLPLGPRRPNARYAPPELWLGRLDARSMEAHRAHDVYSLGLVLWELCWAPWELPLGQWADDQLATPVTQGERPPVPPEWLVPGHPKAALARLLRECWAAAAAARLTAARLAKSLTAAERHAAAETKLPLDKADAILRDEPLPLKSPL